MKSDVAYIVETNYRAGIWKSRYAIAQNMYLKYAKVEEFESFEEAVKEFDRRYGEVLDEEELILEYLYKVRDNHDYSVFGNAEFVCFCKTSLVCTMMERAEWLAGMTYSLPYWCTSGYTYDEAQNRVRKEAGMEGRSRNMKKLITGIPYAIPKPLEKPGFFD